MGYTTDFSGAFKLNKALRRWQIAALKAFVEDEAATRMDKTTPGNGSYCQWVPADDGSQIEWDGGEKFYHYEEWINHLIIHFLEPWGYTLSGEVRFQGEDIDDNGVLVVDEETDRVVRKALPRSKAEAQADKILKLDTLNRHMDLDRELHGRLRKEIVAVLETP